MGETRLSFVGHIHVFCITAIKGRQTKALCSSKVPAISYISESSLGCYGTGLRIRYDTICMQKRNESTSSTRLPSSRVRTRVAGSEGRTYSRTQPIALLPSNRGGQFTGTERRETSHTNERAYPVIHPRKDKTWYPCACPPLIQSEDPPK